MKLYLSSYKIGDQPEKLLALFSGNKKVGYIPNALDFTNANPVRRENHIESDIQSLTDNGLQVELLDLKNYFEKENDLREKLQGLGGIFISGGNTFILRQAMRLCGLDTVLQGYNKTREDFVYAGYSAAGCVLSSSLKGYSIVDDPTDFPYANQKETLWEGLGMIDYTFLPHFDSDHPESADINKEVKYCIENKIPYKTLRDGEVLIIE
ncbi:MAG: Type 1 glutamine amidotransferase-like domain-containing protein [Candidatus Moranbacteria bacterium]|nr:Type 1 glutamine amidotransferase-like domain-containing protein [Candidatus Moranbacteria bacterium]MDD3964919.1 Type 1 glutamine amidotransferase-like domain-containing protein [Candidatus Moranbacteria bacterium]